MYSLINYCFAFDIFFRFLYIYISLCRTVYLKQNVKLCKYFQPFLYSKVLIFNFYLFLDQEARGL